MQGRLALEEGVWVEPAGAAAMAALPGLLAGGLIGAGDRIVCILSGAGFKDRQLATGEAQIISQQQAVAFDVEAVVDRVGDR
jgi:threonine synthase